MTNYLHRARVGADITIVGALIESAVSMCDGVRGFLTEIRKIILFSLLGYVLQEVISYILRQELWMKGCSGSLYMCCFYW